MVNQLQFDICVCGMQRTKKANPETSQSSLQEMIFGLKSEKINLYICFCRWFSFWHVTEGETLQNEEKAWVSGFLSAGFNELLHFAQHEEKQERKLTVLFNIYWVVTIIRDLGCFWTRTVFNEKVLKSYTKLCPLLWAHASSIELGKQTHPFSSPSPLSHSAISKNGNLVRDNQQLRSLYLLVNQDFKKHRLTKVSIVVLSNAYWVLIMHQA